MAEKASSPRPRNKPRPARERGRLSWPGWSLRMALGLGSITALTRYLSRASRVDAGATATSAPSPAPELGTPEESTRQKEETGRPEESPTHPSNRYEPRDVQFGWILALIVLACGIAAIHYYVIVKFFQWQERALEEQRKSPYPLVQRPQSELPPQPRLEQLNRLENVPTSDAFLRESAMERILHSYGPTEEKGFVHIPIRRAIETVADKLPASKVQPHSPESSGLLDGGEPNSGRYYRGELIPSVGQGGKP